MSIATGTRLGQYEVQDFIGEGAMGVVYRAYHPELERTGAVKIMNALSPDRDSVTRFRHEAQAIAQLRHPNIVNVYDFGTFEGSPYMVVEYVPGGSLAGRMADGRLDQATALKYLRGIAAGLDYAHAHGVVHRDVKPANVLLTADDTPVLADFGLAKLLQGTSLKSLTGVTTGTPAYMAPEQVAGHQVGPAADRYSLATIAYEMLTGVIPFDGYALMEMLYAHVHNEPPPPSSRLPDLSADVDAVLLRGLAKDPGARWPTATAFVEALAAALTHRSRPQAVAAPAVAPALQATMVMAPALASTVPVTPAAVARRVRAVPQAATVAVPFPERAATPAPAASPAAGARKRINRRQVALALAALLVLLLIFGTCEVLARAVTLDVNPSTASRGDVVTVTAANVPANQVGEIQLWSVVHTFPFRADSNGKVRVYMTLPYDVALGDHTVKICWSDSCHAEHPLRVVSGVAQVVPTPIDNRTPVGYPTPSSSPTAAPTAPPAQSSGSTPLPTSNPTSNPTAAPTPPPSPKPTANPCPGNSNPLVLSPSNQTVLVAGGNANFTGSNFTPNSTVSMSYYAPQSASSPTTTWSVTASCTGAFSTSVATKTNLLGVLRTDKVVACDVVKHCVSATVSVPVGL